MSIGAVRRAGGALSIVRPRPVGAKAPTGKAARELTLDHYQGHPGYGLTPQRLVSIFRTAEYGAPRDQCDLFDDVIENDPHLRNLFDQRAQAVAGKPWVIQAGGSRPQDELAAQLLRRSLARVPAISMFFEHQLTFNRYGWAASEIDWDFVEIDGRQVAAPIHFANVPARRFRISKNDELRLITKNASDDGEELEPGKWIVTRRSGVKVSRSALMRTAAWFALYKRFGTRDWVIYAEKFGIPLVLAVYEETLDEDAKDVAAEIVENIGDDGGAVVHKGIEIKIHNEGRNADSSTTHGGLISYCNREMSKLVNGSTLSNDNGDSGGASYALGDVHAEVRWDNVLFDAERIQESFRDCVSSPFVQYNELDAEPPALHIRVVRDLAPTQLVNIAAKLRNELGVGVSVRQLRQITGLQEPAGDDDAAPGMAQAVEVTQ